MPELVISCIFSKLTMKNVVKIGIQLRRWVNIRLLSTDLNFDVPNMFYSINEMLKFSYFLFAFGNNKNRGKPMFDNEVLNIFARIRHELPHQVDQFCFLFGGKREWVSFLITVPLLGLIIGSIMQFHWK